MKHDNTDPTYRRTIFFRTTALFCLIMFIGIALITFSEIAHYERERSEAIKLSAEQGVLIQRQLNQSLSSVYALADLLRQGHGQIDDFEEIANRMLAHNDSINSLQLAPDAIIQHIIPLAGNERAIGHNLLKDEKRTVEVKLAIESRALTLAGPFNLVQGGLGLVARLPVFIDDPSSPDGQRFWGFSNALFHVDRLLASSYLDRLQEHGYDFELWRIHPDTGQRDIFARSADEPLVGTHNFGFDVPNGYWTLSIVPKTGWINYPLLFAKLFLTILISLIITALGYKIFKQPLLLNQMVCERTQNLIDANNALNISNKLLEQSEKKFRNLVETTTDVIYTLDTEGNFTYISPGGKAMFGSEPDSLLGHSFIAIIYPDDEPAFTAFFKKVMAGNHTETGIEYRVRHADGEWHWHTSNFSPLTDSDDLIIGVLGIGHDINTRKENESRIFHLAHFDPLTDLPNRSLFSDRLQKALETAERSQYQLALLCVDLDSFKPINDTWGHAVGDEVLKQVAERMQKSVRASDTVGRIGGDEFSILLPSIPDVQTALNVAEKISLEIKKPITVDTLTLTISASIGISLYPDHAQDEITLSRLADQAMYTAKNHLPGSVRVYEKQITDNK